MKYCSATNISEVIKKVPTEESWKHYAKGKKPVSEDRILYGSVYMKCPKQANPQITQIRLVVVKFWGGRQ